MFFDQGIARQQIIMNFTPSVQSGAIFLLSGQKIVWQFQFQPKILVVQAV